LNIIPFKMIQNLYS